jgi:hypothetical protein
MNPMKILWRGGTLYIAWVKPETHSTTIHDPCSGNQEPSSLCLLRHPPQCRDLGIRTATQEEDNRRGTVFPTR